MKRMRRAHQDRDYGEYLQGSGRKRAIPTRAAPAGAGSSKRPFQFLPMEGYMPLLISLLVCLLLISDACAEVQRKEETTISPTDEKPRVVQWQVSHSRLVDQISIIFRKDTAELVTNTFSFQRSEEVRLGWFQSPMNFELELLKQSADLFYETLKKLIPMSELLKDVIPDDLMAPRVMPHAPIVRINEEELQRGHPYYEPVARIIHRVWELKDTVWICVDCATYKRVDDLVVRTTRKMLDENKKQWEVKEQTFPLDLLDCFSTGGSQIECVDSQFGIFRLPDDS